MTLNLSYTKCDCFLRCRQRYRWIYVERLYPKQRTQPLIVGDLVHRVLDLYTQGILDTEKIAVLPDVIRQLYPNNADQEIQAATQEVVRLISGYLQHDWEDDMEIISPEMHLQKDFGDFILYSRLDALAILEGRLSRLERKTSRAMDAPYLKGMKRGLQSGIAHWLLEELLTDLLPEYKKVDGTIFELLVKTKVPKYSRQFVQLPQWILNYSKKVVYGVANDIKAGNFYPSLNCFKYARECSYSILCRNDTPQNRETWFETREEVMERDEGNVWTTAINQLKEETKS